MSKRAAVLIASRVVALYLFCWALDSLSYLPARLVLIPHWTSEALHSYEMLTLEATVLRAVAFFGAAMLFYECGPRVEAFLLPAQKQADAE